MPNQEQQDDADDDESSHHHDKPEHRVLDRSKPIRHVLNVFFGEHHSIDDATGVGVRHG